MNKLLLMLELLWVENFEETLFNGRLDTKESKTVFSKWHYGLRTHLQVEKENLLSLTFVLFWLEFPPH